MEYDPDDPPPVPTWQDNYWYVANRAAENLLGWLRLWGLL